MLGTRNTRVLPSLWTLSGTEACNYSAQSQDSSVVSIISNYPLVLCGEKSRDFSYADQVSWALCAAPLILPHAAQSVLTAFGQGWLQERAPPAPHHDSLSQGKQFPSYIHTHSHIHTHRQNGFRCTLRILLYFQKLRSKGSVNTLNSKLNGRTASG